MVSNNGSLILFYARKASDTVPEGLNLYQPETGKHVSLKRELNSCEETDESGIPIDESSCQYTLVPISIGDLAQAFTASGSNLTINSVSRMTEDSQHSVESFILDVNTGAIFTLPNGYSTSTTHISADGSVLIGITEQP